ncbi:MAG TPA: hypothetical protein VNN73_19785 [Blastocatellia bacterium]|nr:hypothetical protein [Blastocatellia bacterium]
MAEYPAQYIKNADRTATKEGWPLIGLIILDMIVTVVALYIVGEIANKLF